MDDRATDNDHHQSVLADKVVELLITKDDGAYLDLTAGDGGHLLLMADKLKAGARLYGIDADPRSVARAVKRMADQDQFRLVYQSRFSEVAEVIQDWEDQEFDGVLFDLGISSGQLDDPSRGISFKNDGPLDMRFDPSANVTARDLINSLELPELRRIIGSYGEERQAAKIASAIVRERQKRVITTTLELREIILSVINPPHQNKSLARVFQAFRIAVNQELEQLEKVLPVVLSLLKVGGRVAVIAYHSLEDRIVKQFFQSGEKGNCSCPDQLAVCVCGASPTMKRVTRKPIFPTDEEIAQNPRARSARLRVAEKI